MVFVFVGIGHLRDRHARIPCTERERERERWGGWGWEAEGEGKERTARGPTTTPPTGLQRTFVYERAEVQTSRG